MRGPGPLAEELTQQTFVEAVRRRGSFDGRSEVVTWLCSIGRHKLADHYRRLERDERHRLRILGFLKDPERNFPPQVDGDLVEDGVCAIFIEEKLGLAQPTTAQHLKALVDSGFLIPKRIKKWTFYKRDENSIAQFLEELRKSV